MKAKGSAAIIFRNDYAVFVVIGSNAAAKKKLNELKKIHKHNHTEKWHIMDAETYEHRFVWHIVYADYKIVK